VLLTRLAERAREEGMRAFTALVTTENRSMQSLLERVEGTTEVRRVTGNMAEYEIELAPKGLGAHLESALRAAADGSLRVPPRMCDALRALVPLRLDRR
jgi:hypothetical protein